MDETTIALPVETETRSMTIQIRVTPAEYAILDKMANDAHLKIGTFIRSFMLTHNSKSDEKQRETA